MERERQGRTEEEDQVRRGEARMGRTDDAPPADEDARHLFQPLRRHPDARPVPDVEPERLVAPVLQQLHPPAGLRHQVHVDDRRHLAELLGVADPQVVLLGVLGRAAQDGAEEGRGLAAEPWVVVTLPLPPSSFSLSLPPLPPSPSLSLPTTSRLVPGGLAESTGLLAVNDEVLEVNGIEVAGKSLDQVTDMMVANSSNLIVTVKPANQRTLMGPRRGSFSRNSAMSAHSMLSSSTQSGTGSEGRDEDDDDRDEVVDHHGSSFHSSKGNKPVLHL
jgi:hypothetical protein